MGPTISPYGGNVKRRLAGGIMPLIKNPREIGKRTCIFKTYVLSLGSSHERAVRAPLAQLDRASGYGPEGRGFESLRAYQNHGNPMDFRGFAFVLCTFSGGLVLRYRFDPSRDPYQSEERKSPESTGEEVPHRVRRLFLHGGGDVGIGVEGKSGGVMAQHGGESFHIHAVLQGQHRKCVT